MTSRSLARSRVLVADDDLIVLRVIAQALTNGGADVETCQDGAAALASVSRLAPDLLILDIAMPGMGGIEVLEALRGSPQTATLPVVIHTGCAETDFMARAKELGAAAVLHKPTRPSEVVETARQVLAGEQSPPVGLA